MIEFTFTFMLVIVLLAALVLFGWVFFSYASVIHAAREASHHLMLFPETPQFPEMFNNVQEETWWVVTKSLPLLNHDNITVTSVVTPTQLPPPPAPPALGSVWVRVEYRVPLPRFEIPIPVIAKNTKVTLVPPIVVQGRSRRNLD